MPRESRFIVAAPLREQGNSATGGEKNIPPFAVALTSCMEPNRFPEVAVGVTDDARLSLVFIRRDLVSCASVLRVASSCHGTAAL